MKSSLRINIEGVTVGLDPAKNELTIHISDEPITIQITPSDAKAMVLGMASQIIKPTNQPIKEKPNGHNGVVRKTRRPSPTIHGQALVKQRGESIVNHMKKAKRGVSFAELEKALDLGSSSVYPALYSLMDSKQVFRSQSAPCYTRYGLTQKLAQEASDALSLS